MRSVDHSRPDHSRPDHSEVLRRLGNRSRESVVVDGDPAEATVQQAGLGYQLFAAGTRAAVAADLHELVDAVFVSRSELPVMLARPAADGPTVIRRVLLPVAATVQSRAATELAVAIAAAHGASLFLLHVQSGAAEPAGEPGQLARAVRRSAERAGFVPDDPVGAQILWQANGLAKEAGVRSRRVIVRHPTRGLAIVETARRIRSDLVVIAVTPQQVADHVFLGQTASHVLAAPDLNVLVVAVQR